MAETVVGWLVGDSRDGGIVQIRVARRNNVLDEPPDTIFICGTNPVPELLSPLTAKPALVYKLTNFKITSQGGRYIYQFSVRKNWPKRS